MSVTVTLSKVKALSNTSTTSIVELSNFNFKALTSAMEEFLTSINYEQGAEVTVDIDNIDGGLLTLREGLKIYGNEVGGGYPTNIELSKDGSITAKNITLNDVTSAKRLRLRMFGVLPTTGIPGEMVYIQAQGAKPEGIYVWLNSTGWTLLYGIGTGTGNGGNSGSICQQQVLHSVLADSVSLNNTLASSSLFMVPAPIATGQPILYVNGLQTLVGNGSKTGAAYFSKDGGVTASNIGELDATDLLYFNPTIADYDLETHDTLTLVYPTIDPYCAQSGYYCNTVIVSSGTVDLSPFPIQIITSPDSAGPLRVCQIPNPIDSGTYTLPSGYDLANTLQSYTISDPNNVFGAGAIIRFTITSSVTEDEFDEIKIFHEVGGVLTDVTITSGAYAPNFASKYIYASVSTFSPFYLVQGSVTTTTTTSTTTTTTLACPANNISYTLAYGSNPTKVAFSGTPAGPLTLEFVDQHGTIFDVTGLLGESITLPWTLDLTDADLSSLSTVIGVYTFTYNTSCDYEVEIPLSAIDNVTTTTTTIAPTTTTTSTSTTTTSTSTTSTTSTTTVAPTTTTTTTNYLSYVVDSPVQVTFFGSPSGPYEVKYIDASSNEYDLTALSGSEKTLPWSYNRTLQAYVDAGITTISGTYEFRIDGVLIHTVNVYL